MPTCWRPWARRSSRRAITRSWQRKDEGRNAGRKPTRSARLLKQVMSAREEEQPGLRGTSTTASANPSRRYSGLRAAARCLRLRKRAAGELRGITASLLDESGGWPGACAERAGRSGPCGSPGALRGRLHQAHGIAVDVVARTWPWPVCRPKWRRLCTASPRRRSRMS
jgi:hypothetical protein